MKRISLLLLSSFIFAKSFSQIQHNTSLHLSGQFNKTIYDETIGNNPWGIGLGLQCFFNNKAKFKPITDFTADAYLEDDKIYRINEDGSEKADIEGAINLFGGASYNLNKIIYVSLVAGPSLIGGKTFAGIKPSFGFYFSGSQRLTGRISYINVFNRTATKKDFGTICLSLGVRLF
ncbi:hypothetical protein DC498_17815 [Terrimonas sp.]|uniref:hypothetical protein n=1 Tax=Terrimonas sp. TaxID=1914338 RepID=UPI000D50D096|nr:hypothetical protein [Terrimonas sp.]PVD50826.1 hypothetical protein DC498_17815 [Terrimonas sp.]